MVEEIKVGEYVRLDRNQGINKIVDIEDDVYYLDTEIWDEWGETTWSIYKEKLDKEITKHSPNIIDLIECGDYVNGHLVIAVDRERLEVSIENCAYGSDYEDINGNIDIKSIVTKEQFNSIKYVIGEWLNERSRYKNIKWLFRWKW